MERASKKLRAAALLLAVMGIIGGSAALPHRRTSPPAPAPAHLRHRLPLADTDQVCCVAFSPDAATLAEASYFREPTRGHQGRYLLHLLLRLWDVRTGRAGRPVAFGPPEDELECMALSNGLIATGWREQGASGSEYRVRVWDARTLRPVLTLNSPDKVSSLTFSRDGKLLGCGPVAFSLDGATAALPARSTAVQVWDVPTGKLLWHNDPIGSRAKPETREDYLEGPTSEVELREPRSGALKGRLRREGLAVRAVLFSPNGGTLVWVGSRQVFAGFGSREGSNKIIASRGVEEVSLWDVRTGKLLRAFEGERFANSYIGADAAALGPGGTLAVYNAARGQVTVWDLVAGKRVRTWAVDRRSGSSADKAALSPDGRVLAQAGEREPFLLWDVP